MPRKKTEKDVKTKDKVAETKANQAARAELRGGREVFRLTLSPEPFPPPPKVSYNTIKKQALENRRLTVEASLIPAPADNSDFSPPYMPEGDDDRLPENAAEKGNVSSFGNIKMSKRNHEKNLKFWRDIGYYDLHPNHKKAKATEAHLTNLIENHEDFGDVKEKYNLFINPSKKRVMLLQYPNRDRGQTYREKNGQKPLEIRIKPKSGVVEVDIPLNIHSNYNKDKGIEYGAAMRQSKLLQRGGSYDLAGGLGVGPNKTAKEDEASLPDGPTREKLLENFDDSNNKGHVMNKITLGGRIVPLQDGDPIMMVATFQDTRCTFTKLDAMVQLRPQFSHLDAIYENDKSVAHYDRADEERGEDAQAEDVNVTVKDTEKKKDLDMYGGMMETAKLLRAIRDEPWQRLDWIDQDDVRSYEAFHDNLVYKDPDNAPQLVSEMTHEQYLDAISCPRIDPITQGKKIMRSSVKDYFSSEEDEETGKEEAGKEEAGKEEAGKEDKAADSSSADEVSEGGTKYEYLPKGANEPPGLMERDIERTCRMICMRPKHKRHQYEALITTKKGHLPKFAFLKKGNKYHIYYKWRLERNEAGKGIGPEHDYGLGPK